MNNGLYLKTYLLKTYTQSHKRDLETVTGISDPKLQNTAEIFHLFIYLFAD